MDRGFGRCIVLRKYGAVVRRYPNRSMDRIVAPKPGPSPPPGERGSDASSLSNRCAAEASGAAMGNAGEGC